MFGDQMWGTRSRLGVVLCRDYVIFDRSLNGLVEERRGCDGKVK